MLTSGFKKTFLTISALILSGTALAGPFGPAADGGPRAIIQSLRLMHTFAKVGVWEVNHPEIANAPERIAIRSAVCRHRERLGETPCRSRWHRHYYNNYHSYNQRAAMPGNPPVQITNTAG